VTPRRRRTRRSGVCLEWTDGRLEIARLNPIAKLAVRPAPTRGARLFERTTALDDDGRVIFREVMLPRPWANDTSRGRKN
jgi:hypothetical protein